MGNQLTHGLLAGAIMAIANLLLGLESISWNVFMAAIVAIALNLDSGDARVSEGSPLGHSLGFGIFIVYLVGTVAYLSHAFLGLLPSIAIHIVLAVGVGVFAHLMAEIAAGEQVFILPNNLRPESWLVKSDCQSARFWSAWSRFSLRRWRMRDSFMNTISLAAIILSIGLC